MIQKFSSLPRQANPKYFNESFEDFLERLPELHNTIVHADLDISGNAGDEAVKEYAQALYSSIPKSEQEVFPPKLKFMSPALNEIIKEQYGKDMSYNMTYKEYSELHSNYPEDNAQNFKEIQQFKKMVKDHLNKVTDMIFEEIRKEREQFVRMNPQLPGMKTHRDRKPKVKIPTTPDDDRIDFEEGGYM